VEVVEWKTRGKSMPLWMGQRKQARYGLMWQIRSGLKIATVLWLAWLRTRRKTLGRLTTSLLFRRGPKAGDIRG